MEKVHPADAPSGEFQPPKPPKEKLRYVKYIGKPTGNAILKEGQSKYMVMDGNGQLLDTTVDWRLPMPRFRSSFLENKYRKESSVMGQRVSAAFDPVFVAMVPVALAISDAWSSPGNLFAKVRLAAGFAAIAACLTLLSFQRKLSRTAALVATLSIWTLAVRAIQTSCNGYCVSWPFHGVCGICRRSPACHMIDHCYPCSLSASLGAMTDGSATI
jgi:hypothetical protein